MNGPQLEHGHTRIAHEILEQISKLNLNGTQFRLIMAVWRSTYGYHKKSHELSISYLANFINASRGQVDRELNTLIEMNIIKVFGSGQRGVRLLGFNKNFKDWYNDCTLNRGLSANQSTELSSNQRNKKDIYKDNNKDIPEEVSQKEKYDENNTYYKMANYFHSLVSDVANQAGVSHLIKKSNMQNWANDMRLLVEKDQVDKRLAKQVMDWVTQDPFWRTNVLSAKKLREKFTELAIKMNTEQKRITPKKQTDPRDIEIAANNWIAEGNDPNDFDWVTGKGVIRDE